MVAVLVIAPALLVTVPVTVVVLFVASYLAFEPVRERVPATDAVFPAPENATVTGVALLIDKVEPLWMSRSVPAPPLIVKVGVTDDARASVVSLEINNCPIVCVGTSVIEVLAPLLKMRTSSVAGVVRDGLQFVAVVHDDEPVWLNV